MFEIPLKQNENAVFKNTCLLEFYGFLKMKIKSCSMHIFNSVNCTDNFLGFLGVVFHVAFFLVLIPQNLCVFLVESE